MNYTKTKRRKLHFLTAIALIWTLTFSSTTAFAADTATPVLGHRMTGGISDVYIYIDGSNSPQATYWQNLIKTAVDNWMYTGVGANNFYCLGYVSSGTNGSKIDWYARNNNFWGDGGFLVFAQTTYFDYGINGVNPEVCDWYSAQIDLNDTILRLDTISNDQAIGTFVHEMGHAFGLAHNNTNPNSIMCQVGHGRAVQRVQRIDNDALNRLY